MKSYDTLGRCEHEIYTAFFSTIQQDLIPLLSNREFKVENKVQNSKHTPTTKHTHKFPFHKNKAKEHLTCILFNPLNNFPNI